MLRIGLALALLGSPLAAFAQTPDYGADLERFDYPYPVQWFETRSQGAPVRMAYLDVRPNAEPRATIVLLHGKNFCAATWGDTIRGLVARGYRVVAPDQIGFCKSSKPAGYQYSFHALATLTAHLLDQAGAPGKIVLVGHSTGGVLATRFALLHPDRVSKLVLVNPLGLNDTLAEGVPYTPLDGLRAEEAKTNAASIKTYQQRNYYNGQWRPAYDHWVAMLAGQYASKRGDTVREAQARLSDMIQTQPVAAELGRVRTTTTLIIGQTDNTAFRANTAPEAIRANIRTVPQAAETAVKAFPDARLVRLDGLGHSPQVEDSERFLEALDGALSR
ncbi:alpha/beta fold hydrolase [Sphingomonas sp. LM7]|uniref:alpha/beta fold hydrolase n=1 Tax=Sphingomonas sp. LM7 TaxID=1938607 RepID=UPI00098390F7|nr:alpha/beta hydrolase [Sphingomonas sp. LM7]AQR73862.1 alpha/beta hydrolase [Sphingomonas sp. LM7]